MSLFEIKYDINKASESEIFEHLRECSNLFIVPLSNYVNIGDYAHKIRKNATTIEAWVDNVLVGLVAVYLNDSTYFEGYITNVSVLTNFQKKGISQSLMLKTEEISKIENFKILKLSVFENNELALKLYIKNGFKIISIKDNKCLMSKDLRNK